MSYYPEARRILTPTDRDFLRTVPNYYNGENARQSRYQRRRDIRERIVGSLYDFYHIRHHLEKSEREKIFTEPEKNGSRTTEEFHMALESLLWWVYMGCRESGRSFDSVLETAVRLAEQDYHWMRGNEHVDVDVTFDVEVIDEYEGSEEFVRRLEEGEPVRSAIIYRIPTLPHLEIDVEKIDTVRFLPSGTHPKKEREIIATIFRECLGIEPEIKPGFPSNLAIPDNIEDIDLDTSDE